MRTTECSGAEGFSLVELIIALVVFQVGMLGVVGLMLTATRVMSRAAAVERALSLAEPVADSLLWSDWSGPGERIVPPFVVRWEAIGDQLVVDAWSHEGQPRVVRLVLLRGAK